MLIDTPARCAASIVCATQIDSLHRGILRCSNCVLSGPISREWHSSRILIGFGPWLDPHDARLFGRSVPRHVLSIALLNAFSRGIAGRPYGTAPRGRSSSSHFEAIGLTFVGSPPAIVITVGPLRSNSMLMRAFRHVRTLRPAPRAASCASSGHAPHWADGLSTTAAAPRALTSQHCLSLTALYARRCRAKRQRGRNAWCFRSQFWFTTRPITFPLCSSISADAVRGPITVFPKTPLILSAQSSPHAPN